MYTKISCTLYLTNSNTSNSKIVKFPFDIYFFKLVIKKIFSNILSELFLSWSELD